MPKNWSEPVFRLKTLMQRLPVAAAQASPFKAFSGKVDPVFRQKMRQTKESYRMVRFHRSGAGYKAFLYTLVCAVGSMLVLNQAAAAPISSEQAESIAKPLVERTIEALAKQDFQTLSTLASRQGVYFSPYLYLDTDKAIRLQPAQLAVCAKDKTKRLWGYKDGSGDPIYLRCSAYFKDYLWVRDFRKIEKTNYNTPFQRSLDIDNHLEIFPEDIRTWRYFPDPKEGNSWYSLHLLFIKEGENWVLAAIINGRWVI